MYKFYGNENANIKDSYGNTPKDYYDMLSDIWSINTCAPRLRGSWTKDNKTLGQCSITAFLMQDLYGGEVYGIPLKDGNYHCFNVIGDITFDLTSEQFQNEVLDYNNRVLQSKEEHFKKIEKKERYEYLKEMLFSKLKKGL